MILLTAIESLREEEKEAGEQEDKGSRPGNATLDVASVETAKAWSDQSERKASYQWISGLKMLGELILYTKKRMVGATTCDVIEMTKYCFRKEGSTSSCSSHWDSLCCGRFISLLFVKKLLQCTDDVAVGNG